MILLLKTLILPAKMAKRARMTTDDVPDALYSSDEDDSDVDDPDKPFMDGNDDEFSDLNGEEDDDEDMDTLLTSCHLSSRYFPKHLSTAHPISNVDHKP